MKKLLAVLTISILVLNGCSKPDTARIVLTKQGYTNIHIGGWSMWKCSKDDKFTTTFTATSPSGNIVSGAVCGGFFKGSTIRLDD